MYKSYRAMYVLTHMRSRTGVCKSTRAKTSRNTNFTWLEYGQLVLGRACSSHVKVVLLRVLECLNLHISVSWSKLVTAHVAR